MLGLAARRKERRSYLAFVVDSGDYVIEIDEMLPRQLAGALSPILRQYETQEAHSGTRTAEIVTEESDGDPIDQIRRLGELRDAGYITVEEFETKKAELLGRL